MEIVVDTNVFIHAFFHGNTLAHQILTLENRGNFRLVISVPTSDELMQTFIKVYARFNDSIERLEYPLMMLSRALARAKFTDYVKHKDIWIYDDSEDDKFINSAIQGCARYIISNDHHLLDFRDPINDVSGKPVYIKTPGEFLIEYTALTINQRRI